MRTSRTFPAWKRERFGSFLFFFGESRRVDVDYGVVRHLGRLGRGGRLQPDLIRRGIRPRHQGVQVGRIAGVGGVGHLGQQPFRVLARVQAAGLGRRDHRVNARRGLGTARRVAEEEVLAADYERFDGARTRIVAYGGPCPSPRSFKICEGVLIFWSGIGGVGLPNSLLLNLPFQSILLPWRAI